MASITEILQKLESGEYVLPEFQRGFVWNNRQVKELVESIYNKYPIGMILRWEMNNEFRESYISLLRPILGVDEERIRKNAKYLVIDGQQRLTSLLLVKRGSINVNGRKRMIKLYFNPVTKEFKLARGEEELEKSPLWFNVTELFDIQKSVANIIREKAEKSGDNTITENPKVEEGLHNFRERLRTYIVPIWDIDLEPSEDFLQTFEKLADIFVKINRSGTKIRTTELVLALLTANIRAQIGNSFKKEVDKFLDKMKRKGWDLDIPVFIRTFMAISKGIGRLSEFNTIIKESDSELKEKYDMWLKETEESLEETISLLSNRLGIDNSDLLSSKYVLVPMAYYISLRKREGQLTPNEIDKLLKWFILASYWGRYSAALDSRINEDIKAVKNLNLEQLINNIGRRKIDEESFSGDLTKAHRLVLYYLLTRIGAYDWNLDRPIPAKINDFKIGKLHVHHIFPREYLRDNADKLGEVDVDELANDVANLTLISEEANEKIGDEAPSKYLKKLKERDVSYLETHLIPLNEKLWRPENYLEFLKERRKIICNKLNELLSI